MPCPKKQFSIREYAHDARSITSGCGVISPHGYAAADAIAEEIISDKHMQVEYV